MRFLTDTSEILNQIASRGSAMERNQGTADLSRLWRRLDEAQALVEKMQGLGNPDVISQVPGENRHLFEAQLSRDRDQVNDLANQIVEVSKLFESLGSLITLTRTSLNEGLSQTHFAILDVAEMDVPENHRIVRQSDLDDVGLSGASLDAKLDHFNFALARLRGQSPGRTKAVDARRALEVANIIIGSLAVIPALTLVVEPMKEAKDLTESDLSFLSNLISNIKKVAEELARPLRDWAPGILPAPH